MTVQEFERQHPETHFADMATKYKIRCGLHKISQRKNHVESEVDDAAHTRNTNCPLLRQDKKRNHNYERKYQKEVKIEGMELTCRHKLECPIHCHGKRYEPHLQTISTQIIIAGYGDGREANLKLRHCTGLT